MGKEVHDYDSLDGEIYEALCEYCKVHDLPVVPRENIHNCTDIVNDLGMDSLDCQGLAAHLEEKFNMEIPEDVVPGLTMYKHLVEYIAVHRNSRKTQPAPASV